MCTDIRFLDPENHCITVRNLDFDKPMDNWVAFVPKGTKFRSIEPIDRPAQAMRWTNAYNYVAIVSIPAHLAGLPSPFLFDHLAELIAAELTREPFLSNGSSQVPLEQTDWNP